MRSAIGEDDWREELARWIQRHPELGIDGDRLEIVRLENPSGWYANLACTVSDGRSRLHAKLGPARDELRRAFDLGPTLTARYRCPPILAWIDLGKLSGFLMPSIEADPGSEAIIPEVVALAERLYRDDQVSAELRDEDQPDTFREAFLDLWIARFTTDLDELISEDKVPPFVSTSDVEWMRRQTGLLAEMTASSSFDGEPEGAVHGDLHLGNVLVPPDGDWRVVDWDDLHRGDLASDLATLLAPLIERGEPVGHLLGTKGQAFDERFVVCERAVILDLVIDSLADWADADLSPGAADSIRSTKRAAHEHGLRIYRERYAA